MELIDRCLRIRSMSGKLMEKNQELKTAEERSEAGFNEIYAIIVESEIMLESLKNIKRALL